MQPKILAWSIVVIAVTAASAGAQWFPYPYPGSVIGYPAPGYYQGRSFANVRTQVRPRDAQVFVDGYAAGIVDDFDGVFQRLQLIPGQHEITLFLTGYRTYRENVYLSPGSSLNIRHTMVQRPAGEADEAAPIPLVPPMAAGRGMPPRPIAPLPSNAPAPGMLSLRVEPGDASVLIDGEAWRAPQSQTRLSVALAEGHHHLQIEKSGFDTFAVDIDVKAGETTALAVSLTNRMQN